MPTRPRSRTCCIKSGLSAPACRTVPRHLLALRDNHARGPQAPTTRLHLRQRLRRCVISPTIGIGPRIATLPPATHSSATASYVCTRPLHLQDQLPLQALCVTGLVLAGCCVLSNGLLISPGKSDCSLRFSTFHNLDKQISRHNVSRQDDALQAGGAGRRRCWQNGVDYPGMTDQSLPNTIPHD